MTATRGRSFIDGRILAKSAHGAERGLAMARDRSGRLLDRLQLQLRVIEAKLDPEAKRWEQEVRAAVADGSIKKRLSEQPTPEEILEHWRRTATS